MSAGERDSEALDAPDAPEVEIPLCLSCGEPHERPQDFCVRCGAPTSTAATAGGYETIRAWGWALGASGRLARTRRIAAIVVVAYGLAWSSLWAPVLPDALEADLFGADQAWVTWLGLLLVVGHVAFYMLVLLYVVRRWWRSRGAPDPRAPDDMSDDVPEDGLPTPT